MKKFNWFLRRKVLLTQVFFDLLICLYFFYSYSNKYFLAFSFSWILVSYILGRYSYIINNSHKRISLHWFKFNLKQVLILFILLFCGKNIFLLIKFLNFKKFIEFEIILSLIKTCLTSVTVQFIYCRYILSKKINRNKLVVIGKEVELNKFAKYFSSYEKELLITTNINQILNNLANVKEIIILDNLSIEQNSILLEEIIKSKIPIYKIIDWIETNHKILPFDNFDGNEIFNIEWKSEKNSLQQRIKRIGDISFSIFLLIPSTFILLVCAILIKLEDGGPVFFKQTRTGLWGKSFELIKLRTMKIYAEKNGAQWAKKNDIRITKIGSVLRKLRIDELPQLIQVISGEMSLIGPRPERPEFDVIIEKEIKYYNMRNWIKPGLSGWAQVNISYGASIEDAKNKFNYDLYYLKNFSFLLDIIIFFKTIKLVFTAKGSQPDKF